MNQRIDFSTLIDKLALDKAMQDLRVASESLTKQFQEIVKECQRPVTPIRPNNNG